MAKGYVTLPVGYERVDNLPLLIDQLFDTYDEAVEYASSDPTAYVGQIFSVSEDGNFGLYIVNSDLSISKVGQDIDLSSTNISIFNNDSGYLTEDEVSELIEEATSSLSGVFTLKGTATSSDNLPTEDVSEGDVYLVPVYGNSEDSTEVTEYEEYVYTSNGWELLGSSTVFGLSEYYTKDEVDALITESTGSSYSTNVYVSASEDDSFTVQLGDDGECGGYSTGDVISNTDDVYTIIKTLLQKYVSPTYTEPSASDFEITAVTYTTDGSTTYSSLSAETTVSGNEVEVGAYVIGITYSVTVDMGDAGSVKSIYLRYSNNTTSFASVMYGVTEGTTGVSVDDLSELLTSGITVEVAERLTTDNFYALRIYYNDGEVKTNNMGEEDSTGQILAGYLDTNSAYIYARRYLYWETSSSEITVPEDSASIKALANSGYVSSSDTLAITINDGDLSVVIAYPTSYGEISSITQATSNLDVKSSFEITTVDSVYGYAGAYGGTTSYYVYSYTALAGLNEDTFTVAW